jgi:hypothetical protein
MNTRFIKHIVLTFILLVFISSCADKKKDNSLTIDAYRKLGMPDPDKQWEMKDYTQAHNVMAGLKWARPTELPVKDSEKSGALFQRMVSLDYLSFLHDSTITRSEKARRITKFGRVYDYWIDVYTIPILKKNYYNREIIDIRIFNLKVTEAALNLAHEINKSHDPADVALQYGYPSIKRAYLECLSDYLQPLTYTSEFDDRDMEKMLDSVHQSIMRNKEVMDTDVVNRLKHSISSIMDSTSSARLRDKYKRLENDLSL